MQKLVHTTPLWLTVLAIGLSFPARADEFLLTDGGRLQGRWVNRDRSPTSDYVVELRPGAQLTLASDQVLKVIVPTPVDQHYHQLAATTPDTVAGHLKLATWCLNHQRLTARQHHLNRVLALEPDHAEARRALGYRKVNGQWMTRKEEMAARGMRMYAGRYRTEQEIAIWENEKKQHRAEREWHAKIKRWYGWLGSSKEASALTALREIRDPFAAPAVAKYLDPDNKHKPTPATKLLLIEILGQIDSPAATTALIDVSLNERDRETYLTALDQLIVRNNDSIVARYVRSLRSKDNAQVNRAAMALGMLGDKAAVEPLIEALVTEHKYVLSQGNPGQLSTTFRRDGGVGGMSFGGKGPKIVRRKQANSQVLGALIKLTEGVNFQYDSKAWKAWLRSQNKTESLDARRD